MSLLSLLAIGLIFTGYEAPVASAQVLYGSIVGTVTDQANAVVPKAAVTVKNAATGLSRQVVTDEAGYYSIPSLPVGAYDVSVSAPGFKALTQTNVNVLINNVTRADLRLEVGALTESVTVEASAAVLQTTKTDVNVNLQAQEIGNLPLSGYRNFQSLVNLVPGATPVRFQNAVIDTPQRDFTTNVNGQDRGDNNTRVDGAPNILVTMPHHMVYVPPVESIEEVNISTNNFDAEQGMTGGAAVTVTTKSGTNQFHGSAFAFHTNNVLRAYTWDENRAGVKDEAQRHPEYRRRQRRRTHQEKQAVLLHGLGRYFRAGGPLRALFRPDERLSYRRFQQKAGSGHQQCERQPHYGAHHGRGLHATPSGNGLRPIHRESGWHRPLGVFQQWTDQCHSHFAPEPGHDEAPGTGPQSQPGRRRKQLSSTAARSG